MLDNSKIYTREDWANDYSFNAAEGQEIEESIYYRFMDSIYPARMGRSYFLNGEAYDHARTEGGSYKARYQLFIKNNNKYYFLGLCFNDSKAINEKIAAFNNR